MSGGSLLKGLKPEVDMAWKVAEIRVPERGQKSAGCLERKQQ